MKESPSMVSTLFGASIVMTSTGFKGSSNEKISLCHTVRSFFSSVSMSASLLCSFVSAWIALKKPPKKSSGFGTSTLYPRRKKSAQHWLNQLWVHMEIVEVPDIFFKFVSSKNGFIRHSSRQGAYWNASTSTETASAVSAQKATAATGRAKPRHHVSS